MPRVRRKIHLDTDIGGDPDDACALAMLLRWPDVEIAGITTVTEIGGRRAGYVHEVLRLAGVSGIPVSAGATDGLSGLRKQPQLPDEADFWPEPVHPQPNPSGEALELIDASITRGATVVGVGPYTNLALYERKYPGRLARSGLVLMGGFIGPLKQGLPPWGPSTDWNMHLDVAATELVLRRCRPLLVPLNVTVETHLRARDLPRLRSAGPLGALLARQGVAYERLNDHRALGRAHGLLPDDLLNFHHDPLACATALGWDGVRTEELRLRVTVDDGWHALLADDEGAAFRVVTAVESERFSEMWLDVIAPRA